MNKKKNHIKYRSNITFGVIKQTNIQPYAKATIHDNDNRHNTVCSTNMLGYLDPSVQVIMRFRCIYINDNYILVDLK